MPDASHEFGPAHTLLEGAIHCQELEGCKDPAPLEKSLPRSRKSRWLMVMLGDGLADEDPFDLEAHDDQRRTWSEALQRASEDKLLEGDGSQIFGDAFERWCFEQAVWFPKGSWIPASFRYMLQVLVGLNMSFGFGYLWIMYYGASVHTGVGIGVFMLSLLGKSYVAWAAVRKRETMIVNTFLLLKDSVTEVVRAPRAPLWYYAGYLFLVPVNILAYLQRDKQPLWVTCMMIQPTFAVFLWPMGMSGIMTIFFCRWCDAAAALIHSCRIVQYGAATQIDWKATRKNLQVFINFMDITGQSWTTYFFAVEFLVVLGAVFLAVGFIEDLAVFLRCSGQACAAPACMASISGILCYLCVAVVVRLWMCASRVTAACEETRDECMDIILDHLAQTGTGLWEAEEKHTRRHSSSLSSDSIGRENLPRRHTAFMSSDSMCKTFKKYLEQKITGFSANGFTISYKLGMELAYPIITTVALVILPILKQSFNLDDTVLKGIIS